MANKLTYSYSKTNTNVFLSKIEISPITIYGQNAVAINVADEQINNLYPENADRNICFGSVTAIVFVEQIPALIAELENIYLKDAKPDTEV